MRPPRRDVLRHRAALPGLGLRRRDVPDDDDLRHERSAVLHGFDGLRPGPDLLRRNMSLRAHRPLSALLLGLAAAGCDGLRRDHYPVHPALPLEGRLELVPGLFGDRPHTLALGRCDDDDRLDVASIGTNDSAPWGARSTDPPMMHLGRESGFVPTEALRAMSRPFDAAIFSDLDGDGHEDLVLAASDVFVLRNLGGCRFAEPVQVATGGDRGTGQILVTDADLDGLADLAVARRGPTQQPFRLLIAQGDGSFLEHPVASAPLTPPEGGMLPFSMFLDDVDRDGRMDLFAMIDQRGAWLSWGGATGRGFARDDELSEDFSQADPMSISPLDHDRDGRMDYFVAGVPGRSLLLRGEGGRGLRDVAYEAEIEGVDRTTAWGSWAFDADLDGWTDVLTLRLGDVSEGAPAGPTQLYINRGDGTFAEVGAARLGASIRAKALVCGDLTGRADLGCFAMAAGGPVLLRDRLTPRGSWAGLRLVGTVSAPPAVGARVAVLGEARPQLVYYGPQGPYGGAHASGLVLGLGARTSADIEVRWPSGLRQRVANLPTGRYTTVTEPAAVTLSARIAPADGRSAVEVTVDPGLVGATRASLHLEGAGALSDQGALPDGRRRWVVTAPAMAGEAVLTVALDGTALRVRPRVRFTTRP